jgi:hypothetical protein
MESLITQYGIDYQQFKECCDKYDAIIAGSSALWEYLKQNGIEPGYVPGDIDIWIYDEKDLQDCDCKNCIDIRQGKTAYLAFVKLLIRHGYNDSCKFGTNKNKFDDMDEYYDMNNINKIVSYINSDGKEIQLIFVNNKNIIHYIKNSFDISACVTYWNLRDDRFVSLFPETTIKKQFFILCNSMKTEKRIQKYIGRGFKLMDRPCAFLTQRDSRENLDVKLKDVVVNDIFALEDISAVKYLETSDWHILIKCYDKFQAYHRKHLIRSMLQKQSFDSKVGHLFDTPFNQTLTSFAVDNLKYADYSIYEIIPHSTIHISEKKSKNLYILRCYTVEQWNATTLDDCKAGLIIMPT